MTPHRRMPPPNDFGGELSRRRVYNSQNALLFAVDVGLFVV